MRLTVRDCLELDAFRPCIIAAGKRNLDSNIRSVSVMDTSDIKTTLKENGVREQMVLTSFSGMKNNYKMQVRAVRELSACGISALVVLRYGRGLDELDAQTIEAAEAVGLPFIVIPKENEVKYADIIDQVMNGILIGEEPKNYLINNTVSHLMDFDRYKTFPAALKEAAVNNEFQAVLISKDFNPVLVVETRHKVTVLDAVRNLQKRYSNDDRGIYGILDVEGIAAYWGSIVIGGEDYFLLLVDNEEKYSAVDITKLAEIIELAIGMWKYNPVRDVKAEFIKALMRGNKNLAYTLQEEMTPKDFNILSIFYGKGTNTQGARDVIENFEAKTQAEVLIINEGEESYGLIIEEKSNQDEDRKLNCLMLYDELKETSKNIRLFHCTGVGNVSSASDCFSLINETWTFVENVFPYKRVFTKYELALVSSCINLQLQGGHIKRNYAELLEPFNREIGGNKAKQLLSTLETFVLDAGMNSSKTSNIMGIHTNTVQYRLKRINEILGVDITGNRVIPALTIALALKRLERAID